MAMDMSVQTFAGQLGQPIDRNDEHCRIAYGVAFAVAQIPAFFIAAHASLERAVPQLILIKGTSSLLPAPATFPLTTTKKQPSYQVYSPSSPAPPPDASPDPPSPASSRGRCTRSSSRSSGCGGCVLPPADSRHGCSSFTRLPLYYQHWHASCSGWCWGAWTCRRS